jgi:hypothetical protein
MREDEVQRKEFGLNQREDDLKVREYDLQHFGGSKPLPNLGGEGGEYVSLYHAKLEQRFRNLICIACHNLAY